MKTAGQRLSIPRQSWLMLILLVALAGAAVSFAIFWSASWTPDTILQYQQARSGHFTDHHPPAMAAMWRLFVLSGHPKGVIALQIALYWVAAFLLLANAPRKSIIAILALIFPTSVALIGVIWKDAEMAVAWAGAWTLLLLGVWRPDYRLVCSAIAAPLILYGALVRYNGFIAAPPLLLLLLVGRPMLKSLLSTAAAYIGLAVLTLLLLTWTDYSVLRASSPRTAQMSLPIFDMAGITTYTGVNAFPFAMTPAEQAQVARCYEPRAWDSLYYKHSACRWTMDRMKQFEASGGSVQQAALRAASAHPLAYLRHRVRYANQFFCIIECDVNVNLAYYEVGVGNVFVKAYLLIFRPLTLWLFAPINALIASILVGWAALRRRTAEQPMILGAALASALNLLSYIPFGVASDQRYAYPSFVLLAFASAGLLSSRGSESEAPSVTDDRNVDQVRLRSARLHSAEHSGPTPS